MTQDERIDELVGRCREALERGDALDVESVVRDHPALASVLRERLAVLGMLHAAARRPSEAGTSSLVGASLGAYRLVRELGSGGMGSVFLAESGGARRAVKVLHAHLLAKQGSFKRFLREAEIGRRVRHENVVATLDADAIDVGGRTVHFLVMEYVEGQTLRSLLDDLGRVPEQLCRHVGREASRALAAVHAAGAVHRDVKPDNILITRENVVKLMDLGVSRAMDDDELRVSQTGAFVGSVRYAAPEQFRRTDAPVDGRADLYALGLTLYELATGAHPFTGDDFASVIHEHLTRTPRPAGEVNPQLSAYFEALLAQLLEKEAARRIGSAAELASILDAGEASPWWTDRARAIRVETRRPLRRIRIPRETALYGRDAELARLRTAFEAAKAGDGRVVLVEGEAGIGKSRLVDEFVGRLHAAGDDVNFLFGSYPPGGAATASGAFSTAYREHFGDDESAIREALPVTPLLVPAFAALLRGDAAPSGSEPLTKDSLQTVFVHATRSLAGCRPTIVLIDDLHFAPEEGRALFVSLALAVPGHRILLVGCTRPGLDEKWVGQLARLPQTSQLAVPRLGPKELVHLLRDALRSERLAEELSALIALRSDGNPFFVFEMLRGLKEGQFLAQRPDGTWHTTQVIRDIQVPSSILDLFNARVADLATEERDLLDVAACCGFEFDPILVGDAVGVARIPALKRLAQVERAHRLVRAAGSRYVFDHHQVQEALYGSLSEPLRAEYHAAIAGALEARTGAATKEPKDLDGAVCVDLAEHFLKGAQGPRALRYLDAALSHLERSYLLDAAVRLADRALRVAGLVTGVARLRLLRRDALRLETLGRHETDRARMDELTALAEAGADLGWRAIARIEMGRHLASVSGLAEAQAAFEGAAALARDAGDRATVVVAESWLGRVLQSRGRFAEAKAQFERDLATARESGNRPDEAHAIGNIGSALDDLGRTDEARTRIEQALSMMREIGDRRSECVMASNLSGVLDSLGLHDQATAQCERSLAIAREIGYRRGERVAVNNLAIRVGKSGRWAESLRLKEESVRLAREVGHPADEAIALLNLGSLLRDLGAPRRARKALDSSLSLCREVGARRPEGYALVNLALVADEEGGVAESTRLFEDCLSLRRSMHHQEGIVDALLHLGCLRSRTGDTAGARAAVEEALASAHPNRGQVIRGLALLACLTGDARQAEVALAANVEALGKSDYASVHFHLWRAGGNRDRLAVARRTLDFLVEHAPREYRESMVENVRLHREIAAAARERGV